MKDFSKKHLPLALISMIVGFSCGFIFTPTSLNQVAQAVTGNYGKAPSDQLTATEWNTLFTDYVDRVDDTTKTGNLTMDGGNIIMSNGAALNMGGAAITNVADPVLDTDAANLGSIVSNVGTAVDGLDLMRIVGAGPARVVCGTYQPTVADWEQYHTNVLRVLSVDTSAAGFAAGDTVHYITNLSGGYTFETTGGSTIYNSSYNSFRFYVLFVGQNLDGINTNSTTITPTFASNYNWRINWCAFGTR